jgi:alpha-D-ribose 1-methylphosphonate 5-triphosphate diphosphatase
MACDTRLHLRRETFAFEAAPVVLGWIAQEDRPILAFNDRVRLMMEAGRFARKRGSRG